MKLCCLIFLWSSFALAQWQTFNQEMQNDIASKTKFSPHIYRSNNYQFQRLPAAVSSPDWNPRQEAEHYSPLKPKENIHHLQIQEAGHFRRNAYTITGPRSW